MARKVRKANIATKPRLAWLTTASDCEHEGSAGSIARYVSFSCVPTHQVQALASILMHRFQPLTSFTSIHRG